jgi:hypothetical protein
LAMFVFVRWTRIVASAPTVIEFTTCERAMANDVTRLTSCRGAALIRCVFNGISSNPMPAP